MCAHIDAYVCLQTCRDLFAFGYVKPVAFESACFVHAINITHGGGGVFRVDKASEIKGF